MNIHEHQAKQILKKYGVVVPKGVFAFTVDELIEKVKNFAQQANSLFDKSTNSFDKEWKEFDKIMTKNNISRKECLLLPINTMLDALSKKIL